MAKRNGGLERIQIRLSVTDLEPLDQEAASKGVTRSAMLRMILRERYGDSISIKSNKKPKAKGEQDAETNQLTDGRWPAQLGSIVPADQAEPGHPLEDGPQPDDEAMVHRTDAGRRN